MRTTEEIGRRGGAEACGEDAAEAALTCARSLFADLMSALADEIDRLRALKGATDEIAEARRLDDLIRRNQKALQSVLDWQLSMERRRDGPSAGKEVIDLEAARREITRRIARLARRG